MNERRRFLQVVGSGAAAMGAGCSAGTLTTSSGTTDTGSGGAGGGSGMGGMGGSTTTTTTGPACTTNPPGTKIGKPTDYASMGLHIVTSKGFLIGRDAGGLFALTAVCPHQNCDMSAVDAQGPFGQLQGKDIVCLCHGSIFGPTGTVVQGPAHTALKAYALALACDGFLYVNKAQVVAVTVRLMA